MEEQLPYLPFSRWLKERYGAPVQKISLNAGLGCPNKDGTIDREGCIFCDVNQSGVDPAKLAGLSVGEQLTRGIDAFQLRHPQPHKFLAYLQAGSNTHAPPDRLAEIYRQTLGHADVVSTAIATRPDCLPEPVLELIRDIYGDLDVWIELGMQSAHDQTLQRIRRNHTFTQVADAVERAKRRGMLICLHLIVGLPGETREETIATAEAIADWGIEAVKFHPLVITRGSALAANWERRPFPLIEEEQYAEIVAEMLRRLPSGTIVQRLGGSGRPEVHLAPEWTRNINRVKNLIVAKLAAG